MEHLEKHGLWKTVEEAAEIFRQIVEFLPDATFVIDNSGKVIAWNRAIEKMTGVKAKDILGKGNYEYSLAFYEERRPVLIDLVIHPEQEVLAKYAYVRREGDSLISQTEPEMLKLGDVHLLNLASPLYDRGGRVIGAIEAIRDITGQKKAERSLRRSESTVRSILHAAPIGICVLKDRKYTSANRHWCESFGYTEESIIGKTTNFLYESDEEYRRVGSELYSDLSSKGLASIKTRLKRSDGVLRDCFVTAALIDPKDISEGTVAVVNDVTDQARAEEALAQSEDRYRSLVEESFDGIFIQRGPKIVFANRRLQEMLGYNKGELLEMDHWLIYHPDYRSLTKERAEARMRGEKVSSHYEVKLQRKDRSWFYGGIGAKVVTVEGKPGIQVWVRDITDRKRAEEELARTEEKYHSIVEESFDGIFIHKGSKIVFANRRLHEMLGYVRGELVGMGPWSICHPDYHALTAERARARLRGEDVASHYEVKLQRKDGSWFFGEIEAKGVPVEGEPGFQVWVRDITDRKRSEEALARSEAQYRSLFDNAVEGIYQSTPEGRLLCVNSAAANFLGFKSAQEFMEDAGHMSNYYADPEDLEQFRSILEREDFVRGFEVQLLKKNGIPAWASLSARVVRNEAGEVLYYEGALVDITARKHGEEERSKLQGQLIQAQKMESVGRLAGGVAHDFNNMLGVILGRAELALAGIDPGSPIHNDLLDIQKAAKRSADLTRQLLGFARRQTTAPKVLDLNDTIAGMLKMLRRLIGEDIDLAWLPGAGIRPVKMDPSQLDQILANLCVNARDAINDVGKITIETENTVVNEEYCKERPYAAPGRYVSIIVSDTGCGMGKDVVDKIFEPFFTTKEVGKGTGLGLAMVYGIVKQNEGWINVYSEPGRGTTFKIYLPAHGNMTGEKAPQADETDITGGSETVLLVEDEEMLLEMGEMMLKRLGYDVLTAPGPAQALEIMKSSRKDIALLMTDVVMPEMNGMDLAERISSIRPGIKCLFTSGYTANVIAQRGVLKEGMNFIQKPLLLRDLARKIRSVLGS